MNKKLFSGKNILLAIKTVVVLLFIIMMIRLYSGIQSTYNALGGAKGSLFENTLQNRIIFKSYLLPVIILLMPLIGIFTKNKVGWLFVAPISTSRFLT
ncbi:MAG: hypothetical protein V7655_08105 [Aequorivita antarctica]